MHRRFRQRLASEIAPKFRISDDFGVTRTPGVLWVQFGVLWRSGLGPGIATLKKVANLQLADAVT